MPVKSLLAKKLAPLPQRVTALLDITNSTPLPKNKHQQNLSSQTSKQQQQPAVKQSGGVLGQKQQQINSSSSNLVSENSSSGGRKTTIAPNTTAKTPKAAFAISRSAGKTGGGGKSRLGSASKFSVLRDSPTLNIVAPAVVQPVQNVVHEQLEIDDDMPSIEYAPMNNDFPPLDFVDELVDFSGLSKPQWSEVFVTRPASPPNHDGLSEISPVSDNENFEFENFDDFGSGWRTNNSTSNFDEEAIESFIF